MGGETESNAKWAGPELAFARSEYDSRLARAREAMNEDGVEAAIVVDPENIFYLTGYQSIGYFTFQALLVFTDKPPILVSRRVNRHMASLTPTLGGFVSIADTDDSVETLLDTLSEIGVKAPLGLEMSAWYITPAAYERLACQFRRQLADFSGVIERLRIIKSPEEIERIRAAARACEAGLAAAVDACQPGVTENDVAAEMHRATIAAGSEYLGHPPLITAGERSAICFAMWRRRPLVRGDVVLLENGGCIDRYHAMLARGVVLGEPTDEMRRAADAIIAGLDAVIERIRPGITSSEADEACRAKLVSAGLGDHFDNRTAYSVGVGFPPNWSEGKTLSLRPGDPTVLEPGMTFHCVPSVFGRSFGMVFSETVLVTDNGCEVLTNYPRELIVK